MIESYVDLTYRGLSLGRRIRLSQVRPSSGYLELSAPMPVGTPLVIAADDGVTFDATVTWVHEQVAGADRAPGMIVAPALADAAAAWWQARVTLPDSDPAPPRPGAATSRVAPVTVRPRSHGESAPVAAPAPAAAPTPAAPPPPTPAMPLVEQAPTADEATAVSTMEMPVMTEPGPPGEGDVTLQRTGEHDVIDDGKATMIMESVDPLTIGLDLDAASGDDDGEDGDGDPAGEVPDQVTIPDGMAPAPRRRKRKSRR